MNLLREQERETIIGSGGLTFTHFCLDFCRSTSIEATISSLTLRSISMPLEQGTKLDSSIMLKVTRLIARP